MLSINVYLNSWNFRHTFSSTYQIPIVNLALLSMTLLVMLSAIYLDSINMFRTLLSAASLLPDLIMEVFQCKVECTEHAEETEQRGWLFLICIVYVHSYLSSKSLVHQHRLVLFDLIPTNVFHECAVSSND